MESEFLKQIANSYTSSMEDAFHNRLMEYSKDILCAMLKRYGEDAGAVDVAISYAKELIEKTKQYD